MLKQLTVTNPLISCYPHHAFYLAIISDKKECLPWIFSNYQNLFLDQKGFCDFLIKTPEYYLYPWFQGSQRIHKSFLANNSIKFIDFLIQSVDNESFVWTYLDEFYLSCSSKYQKRHFVHAVMVSGYNTKQQKFLINGFYKQQKYSTYWVSYQELELSFLNASIDIDFKGYIHLLSYNKTNISDEFIYNLDLLKIQLESHLNSSFEPFLNIQDFYNLNNTSDLFTGINIYEAIKDMYLTKPYRLEGEYDFRPFYVLYEHKKITNMKLEFLKTEKILNLPMSIYNLGRILEQKSKELLMLYIKFKITKDENTIQRLNLKLNDIKNMEIDFVKSLLIYM